MRKVKVENKESVLQFNKFVKDFVDRKCGELNLSDKKSKSLEDLNKSVNMIRSAVLYLKEKSSFEKILPLMKVSINFFILN